MGKHSRSQISRQRSRIRHWNVHVCGRFIIRGVLDSQRQRRPPLKFKKLVEEKRTKLDNSTSFFTRVKPLLCFWIDYITAKSKNQLFRQNPAQTQGSVTISNQKKTSCNQELRIEMNHCNPLGANYNSRIIQNFVELNTWKQKKHNKRLYLRGSHWKVKHYDLPHRLKT